MGLFAGTSTLAHEFWIDPLEFQVDPGETLQAQLRVGQDFDGTNMVYFDRNFTRFQFVQGDSVLPVPGTLGDRPAFSMAPAADGLGIILHETTLNTLNYTEWDKFVAFVEHKGFEGALERHRERGLPDFSPRRSKRCRWARARGRTGNSAC